MPVKLVPELYCTDLERSLEFYIQVCGFAVRYSRPEDRFAYLDLDGAELMLEQTVTPERTFVAAPLEYPLGRGMNLQIETADVRALHDRASKRGCRIFLPLEERWYRRETEEVGNAQFVVMDPDGYLLRFFESLGARALPNL
jgi:catechol 2,3-dioxygenase-like lactoylglutathione lyase family enzyme